MSAASSTASVLAITGLLAEAKVAAGAGIVTVSGGGDATRLEDMLGRHLTNGAKAVISFGIAGGLAPGLRAGAVVVADSIHDGNTTWAGDPQWRARLLQALPQAVRGSIAGVNTALGTAEGKRRLHRASGALAVDMESHIAARLAARHGVPFAALRIIADPAGRTLPHAALVGMKPDGTADVGAVLRSLARRPGDLGALLLTACDAQAAFAALRRARRDLSSLLAFTEFGTTAGTDEPDSTVPTLGDFGLTLPEVTAEGA
ncbi:MAG: phosphorylase [Parafilimonas terrae]|nr:phosphorylase [Parafilimonas terrae]